jgi:hypothetical protein
MVMEHCLVAVWIPVLPTASVTVIVNVKVPAAVGMPEMTPVSVSSVSPFGRLPPVRAKV